MVLLFIPNFVPVNTSLEFVRSVRSTLCRHEKETCATPAREHTDKDSDITKVMQAVKNQVFYTITCRAEGTAF